MTRRELKDLGAAELEVLKVLWDREPATVRDVLNALHSQGRDLAYTTVQTLLTRLESKGVVSSNKSGLAFVYKSAVSRERIAKQRLTRLLHQLYDGAAAPLVLHLMETEEFSQKEISELHSLIDRLDRGGDGGTTK